MAKTEKFLSARVTAEFRKIADETSARHGMNNDSELLTTSIEFLNLASDDKFKDMKISDFMNVFFAVKKGKSV